MTTFNSNKFMFSRQEELKPLTNSMLLTLSMVLRVRKQYDLLAIADKEFDDRL